MFHGAVAAQPGRSHGDRRRHLCRCPYCPPTPVAARDGADTVEPMTARLVFVSENIGGHATMHHHIKLAIELDHPEMEAEFVEAERRGCARRIVGASLPG